MARTSHIFNFVPVEEDSPLAVTLNAQLNGPTLRRYRFLERLFRTYHLKNAVISQVDGRTIEIEGRKAINFSSANYMGFELHPEVLKAAQQGIEEFGSHSGCSRMFASHESLIQLEEDISELCGTEKTLVLANVSQTHQGVIPALYGQRHTTLFLDKHAHMSMHQAALIAKGKGAKVQRVDTKDFDRLSQLLRESSSKQKVLLIDGLYSMSGDIPPIPELQELCDQSGTTLYIDDAHGIGILGEHGGGVRELFNLSLKNTILVGSLQKGIGGMGGFVTGRATLIDVLRAISVPYIFSGALQPAAVYGNRKAIAICRSQEGKQLRRELRRKSQWIRRHLRTLGFDVPEGASPIIPVPVGADIKTLLAGRRLFDRGFYVNSVLFPAVPKGQGILRVSLTAIHTDEEIQRLLKAFEVLSEEMNNSTKNFKETARQGLQEFKTRFFGHTHEV